MDNSRRLYIEWQNQSYACTIKNSQQIRVKSPYTKRLPRAVKITGRKKKMKLQTRKNNSFLFFTYFPCPYVAFGPCFLW